MRRLYEQINRYAATDHGANALHAYWATHTVDGRMDSGRRARLRYIRQAYEAGGHVAVRAMSVHEFQRRVTLAVPMGAG